MYHIIGAHVCYALMVFLTFGTIRTILPLLLTEMVCVVLLVVYRCLKNSPLWLTYIGIVFLVLGPILALAL